MNTFIIAEAGINHNGSIELAKRMVDAAVEANCDAVKFHTFKEAGSVVTRTARKADYQVKNTGNNDSQYEMIRKFEMSYDSFRELKNYCEQKSIIFMSTPFDLESVEFLNELNMKIFKVSSGDLTNMPLLKLIAKMNKPIILSTGMSSLGEIEEALGWIYGESNRKVTLLHCTSNYPTKFEDVNLQAMLTLKKAFKVEVGYSDHTLGIEIPIAAVAMGARVIEKHFTLDKNMEGPDHKASLSVEELKRMVESVRNVEKSLGDGIKQIRKDEVEVREMARRSIVAQQDINVGEIITENMITFKRPANGIEPKYTEIMLGSKAVKKIHKDELIAWNMLQLKK